MVVRVCFSSLLGMLLLGLELQDGVRTTSDEGADDRLVGERREVSKVIGVAGCNELQDAAHDLTYRQINGRIA